MYHSKKKRRQAMAILSLAFTLLICSLFTTVEPVDANALSAYSSFSLEGSNEVAHSITPAPAQPTFKKTSLTYSLEIVAEEAVISIETLQEARSEVETIIEEERKRAEEEARKKAEEEARKKAEEEARKKAEEEARKKAEEEARKKAEEEAQKNQQSSSGEPARREINYTLQTINGYSELEYLAAICFIEAGNNYDGSLAVANVVLNRLLSSRFPDTLYDVIYQKNQFATRRMASTLQKIHSGSYGRCMQAAQDALAGINTVGSRVSFRANGSLSSSQLSELDCIIIGGNTFF